MDSDTQKYDGFTKDREREKRMKRREERRERAIALQRGMSTRVTDQERNPPESGHDQ